MTIPSVHHVDLDGDALADTLSAWASINPHMGVLALLPEAEKCQLPKLQSACMEREISLAGAIFPALVRQQDFIQHGVMLLRVDTIAATILLPEINSGVPDAWSKIADAVEPVLDEFDAEAPKATLYMIFDGLVPNIATILEGLYLRLADRVSYAGVNAGSETFQPMPCLFDRERIVGNGVLLLVLPALATSVLEHGYPAPEKVMTATSAQGNRIVSIDWRPAFDVYQETIRSEYGIDLTPDNFYQYGAHFPFGILRANGQVVVRIPVALTDDGALFCVGEVPENAMLVLLRAPAADTSDCIDRLAQTLGSANGALTGRQMLTFYCAGRRMHLEDGAKLELAELRSRTGVMNIAGALSLGEIGSTDAWGYPMFHNATLVCTPW